MRSKHIITKAISAKIKLGATGKGKSEIFWQMIKSGVANFMRCEAHSGSTPAIAFTGSGENMILIIEGCCKSMIDRVEENIIWEICRRGRPPRDSERRLS